MTGYKRVLLKLSGEVFGGGRVGVDPDVVRKIAREIAAVQRTGVEVVTPPPAGSSHVRSQARPEGRRHVPRSGQQAGESW